MDKKKVIVFGTGLWYQSNKKFIMENFCVIAITDNDEKKHNTEIDGYKIIKPEMINDYEYDLILVATSYIYSLDIKAQLLNMGIPISKIRFEGTSGISPFKLDPVFFAEGLCYEDKKKLFSENIERVILELNSKCNRKCWFCTNSLFCSDDKNVDMSDKVFEKVIEELEQINYSQEICLSFFNEPLISDKLTERVSIIKNRLPNSFVYAFSNGDFLTREKLDVLADSGLDYLFIDIYINEIEYCIDKAMSEAQNLCRKLDLDIDIVNNKYYLKGKTLYKNMEVSIISQDFSKNASNRAESLCGRDLPLPEIKSHPLPCVKNFISYHIDFRGDVWPCPNYHREYEPHRQYCVGNVLDETIYDIYMGEKMTDYRKRNFFERNTLPCRSCIWNFNTFKTNSFLRPFRDRPSVESHDNCSWCTIKERNKS